MESDLRFIERLDQLYRAISPQVGLDLLVYTPAEFEEMKGRAFIRHVLAEGKVLHAA